jgi:ribosomal protein S18 acetylase RimI-like enzyme
MKIEIRKATKEDIDKIFEKFKTWIMDFFHEYSVSLRKKFLEKDFNKEYLYKQAEEGLVMIPFVNSEPIGLLVADELSAGISYCSWVLVDREFQGKGIGKTLLKSWEDEIKKIGGHGLRLNADKRNVEYYKRLGFRLIGLHEKGYYGTDNYLFQKTIAEPKEENFFK